MEKSISFKCQEGSSNKEYHIQMVKSSTTPDTFVINFQYGAIGQTLKAGTKTSAPVSELEANKLYDKMIKERLSKGYKEVGQSGESQFSGPAITEKKTHGIYPQLLNVADESEVNGLLYDDNYLAQPKMDGQRRILISWFDKIIGLNKIGVEVQLPTIIKQSVNGYNILDGEIIGDMLHVFDLLEMGSVSYQDMPLVNRLAALDSCTFGSNIVLVKSAYTTAEKLAMYADLKNKNAEGIVFKRKDSPYVAGRPNSGGAQLKFKFYKEASFIVKDFTKGKRSVGLELLTESGERVHMGKCTIPPNKEIPQIGSVVEVRYLYAYKGGCIFQPNFKEERTDVLISECLMKQLIFKADTEVDEEE